MIDTRAVICYVSRLKARDLSCTTVHMRQADLDALRVQLADAALDTINGLRIVVNESAIPMPRKK